MTKFKPMLAPNESVSASDINVDDYYVSVKLDGIRCIFKEGEMLSRSLKPIKNKQLQQKFHAIKELSRNKGIILDGEIYDHTMTFQEIQSVCMTDDFTSARAVKRNGGEIYEIPDTVKFHLFDCVLSESGDYLYDEPFCYRDMNAKDVARDFPILIEYVDQFSVDIYKGVSGYFNDALEVGYEGVMLKHKGGRYKTGRGTVKEGLIYKFKPFVTFDADILEVVEQTVVDPNAAKKINELGSSETSKKQADRLPAGMASAFVVQYEGNTLKVALSSMTHEERKEVWDNRESYLAKMIEYKGMQVGSKDVPRHPVFIRFREDRD